MGQAQSPIRVAVYIDGFNLYHGLRTKHRRKYLWLDLRQVAEQLLRPGQVLSSVQYFTAPVRDDPPAQARQRNYLNAIESLGGVDVVLGRFQRKTARCFGCQRSWRTYEEKETDVNLAVSLLADGVEDSFDTAILLSGDSDLCPAVRTLHRLRPDKRVIAVFPPKRHSEELRKVVHASFTLGDATIRTSQLPAEVMSATGTAYRRPPHWS